MIEVYKQNPKSSITLGNCREVLDIWLKDFKGRVDMVYIDPPPASGFSFKLIQKVGINQGRITHSAPTSQSFGGDSYFEAMEDVIQKSRELMSDTGNIFVHCSPKTASVFKTMLDSVFGAGCFVNEIILSFGQSANSHHHFGFSHETILFYRKSSDAYFDPEPTATSRGRDRRNHMKKNIAADGRVYYSMSVAGKEYRYYEDDPVYMGDVWDDIEETDDSGRIKYEGQKPANLAERLILSACPEKGLVCDPFCGTGTFGYAAANLGREFIMCDSSHFAVNIAKINIAGIHKPFSVDWGENTVSQSPKKIRFSQNGSKIGLEEYRMPGGEKYYGHDLIPTEDTLVENWSVGNMLDGKYYVSDFDARSFHKPALGKPLKLSGDGGEPCAVTFDVFGNLMLHKLDGI